jgi:hypothetical protein
MGDIFSLTFSLPLAYLENHTDFSYRKGLQILVMCPKIAALQAYRQAFALSTIANDHTEMVIPISHSEALPLLFCPFAPSFSVLRLSSDCDSTSGVST